eukprot:gene23486-biopygen10349
MERAESANATKHHLGPRHHFGSKWVPKILAESDACCPGVTAAGAVGTADCFATIPPGEDTVVMVSAPQHSANYAAIPGRRGFAPHNPPPKPPESHPAKPLKAGSRQPQVGRVRGPAPARAADVPPAALSACPEGAMEVGHQTQIMGKRGSSLEPGTVCSGTAVECCGIAAEMPWERHGAPWNNDNLFHTTSHDFTVFLMFFFRRIRLKSAAQQDVCTCLNTCTHLCCAADTR